MGRAETCKNHKIIRYLHENELGIIISERCDSCGMKRPIASLGHYEYKQKANGEPMKKLWIEKHLKEEAPN